MKKLTNLSFTHKNPFLSCTSIQMILNKAKAVIRINLPITQTVFSGLSRCPAFFSKKQKSPKNKRKSEIKW